MCENQNPITDSPTLWPDTVGIFFKLGVTTLLCVKGVENGKRGESAVISHELSRVSKAHYDSRRVSKPIGEYGGL